MKNTVKKKKMKSGTRAMIAMTLSNGVRDTLFGYMAFELWHMSTWEALPLICWYMMFNSQILKKKCIDMHT